jgi:hypothetical protein
MKLKLIAFLTIGMIFAGVIFICHHISNGIKTEREFMEPLVGKRVVIYKDTLSVWRAYPMRGELMLSNGIVVPKSMVINKTIE